MGSLEVKVRFMQRPSILFLEKTEVCNYADDITMCTFDPIVKNVVAKLENNTLAISELFPNIRM